MHVLLPYKEVHIRLACKLDYVYTTMCIIIVQGIFNVSGPRNSNSFFFVSANTFTWNKLPLTLEKCHHWQ